MSENKLTQRDVNQIHQYEHEETSNARRVHVVNAGKVDLQIDTDSISEAVKKGLQDISFDTQQQSTNGTQVPEIIYIEKQVFVPQIETKIIEVPVITNEVQIVEIEKPIISEVVKIIEIEKPITIEKYIEKVPAWAWSIIITQQFAICGLLYYFWR